MEYFEKKLIKNQLISKCSVVADVSTYLLDLNSVDLMWNSTKFQNHLDSLFVGVMRN